jgi:large subunit ribosomal protein L29
VSKAREALAQVRDLPDEELGRALDRAREELFRLQLGNYTNQVENTFSLRSKRRELARILTVQRARELDLEGQAAGGERRAAAASSAATESEAPEHIDEDGEPQTVADRARAAVGRPRPSGKAKAKAKAKASAKPAASKAAKPAAKSTGKAKAGTKSSHKKSGKE